jgi:hypothetical protein
MKLESIITIDANDIKAMVTDAKVGGLPVADHVYDTSCSCACGSCDCSNCDSVCVNSESELLVTSKTIADFVVP